RQDAAHAGARPGGGHRGRRLLGLLRRAGTRRPLRQGDRRGSARPRPRCPLGAPHGRVRARRRQDLRHRRPHRSTRRETRRTGRGAGLEHGQGPRRRLRSRVRGPRRARAQGSPRRVAALRRALTMHPETRYARSVDLNVAYQVTGEGPRDLVYVPGWVSNIELMWEEPAMAHFLGRLASFSRLILFDKRGTGLSDRVSTSELPTLEQRMDDVRVVMDAADSQRAALFGASEGGVMCALFGATYPERTAALVLYGSYAKGTATSDYPHGLAEQEVIGEFIEALTELWDDAGGLLSIWAPSASDDPVAEAAFGRYLRTGASPSAVVALTLMNAAVDIRHVLPVIAVPTLVIHRTEDMIVTVEAGRDLAANIHGAKYLELLGEDQL